MIRRQRNKLVEVRADLILADEVATEAYAMYFEAQMHRSKMRKLLYTTYLELARTGAAMFSLNPIGIWWPLTYFDI
jgi:hypothetical protein